MTRMANTDMRQHVGQSDETWTQCQNLNSSVDMYQNSVYYICISCNIIKCYFSTNSQQMADHASKDTLTHVVQVAACILLCGY